MIEGIYRIGKVIESNNFLDEFIEDIGSGYKHVFKVFINISDPNKIGYKGIEYEEFDSSKKMKYFYKKGSSNGPDKTPTSKITELSKTIEKKIGKSFKKFLDDNKENLNEEQKQLLEELQKVIENNKNTIIKDIKNKGNENLKEGSIITCVFIENGEEKYVGDMELFKDTFKNNEDAAYRSFYEKFNVVSKTKNKYCYICGKEVKEVWGFVNTYNFYTADKQSYIAGGFRQDLMWKNYPVCPDCAKIMERGKKYIDDNLTYKFCGFDYFIVPQLVQIDDELLKKVLSRMKKYKEFSLSENKSALIENVEEKIIKDLSEVEKNINFNFLFFKKSNNAFNILLFLLEIAPTRLKYLIDSKEEIDKYDNYGIFNEIKTKKEAINFNFSFKFIRGFFPNNKRDGNFDKSFLSILNNIFIGKKISFDFLLKRFMEKIRSEFLNGSWIIHWVLKSFKIILFVEKIGLLDRRKVNMIKNYENDFEKFFTDFPIIDADLKKAIFLEGVLTQKLLNIQFQERNATPFRSRLNGLKIDERIVKRLLTEIINKLEEYGKNYYRELEEVIGEYLLNSDFSNYSIDEISYYFTLGMVLEKHFKPKSEKITDNNNENNLLFK
jgi:CRISPR-associated protein Csh1